MCFVYIIYLKEHFWKSNVAFHGSRQLMLGRTHADLHGDRVSKGNFVLFWRKLTEPSILVSTTYFLYRKLVCKRTFCKYFQDKAVAYHKDYFATPHRTSNFLRFSRWHIIPKGAAFSGCTDSHMSGCVHCP